MFCFVFLSRKAKLRNSKSIGDETRTPEDLKGLEHTAILNIKHTPLLDDEQKPSTNLLPLLFPNVTPPVPDQKLQGLSKVKKIPESPRWSPEPDAFRQGRCGMPDRESPVK